MAVSALNSHHGGEGASSSSPISWILVSEILNARHVSGHAFTNKNRSIQTERVAVLGVKVRRKCASALIAEEVAQWFELSGEGLSESALSQFSLQKENEKFLGVDLRNLNVAMGVTV